MDADERQDRKCIKANEKLTPDDRHYLRFVMKQSHCFESILLEQKMELSEEWQKSFDEVRTDVDENRLNQYLRRQVRRHLKRCIRIPTTDFRSRIRRTAMKIMEFIWR